MLSYRQKIMAALHEVETALNVGSLLSVQRRHNKVAVENSQQVMALTDQRFELGLVNAATLLDAQRRLLISRSALISVRRAEQISMRSAKSITGVEHQVTSPR